MMLFVIIITGLLATMQTVHTGKLLFDLLKRKYFDMFITDGIKTTSPVSVILDGLTLKTVTF